jgi:hypothetical protein
MNQIIRPSSFFDANGIFDAQAAMPFVIAQGLNIETRVYQKRYPTFNYGAHVPVVTEGDPWNIGTMFFTADGVGEAKWLSGSANDMPYNEINWDNGTRTFYMLGSGWQWNIEEVQQAALYNRDLNGSKAMFAADTTERKLNSIAMIGDAEKNWTGFVNSSVVSRVDVAADGTGSSALWSAKTAQLMLRDVNDLLSSVRSTTNEVEWADSLRLPPDAFRIASTREFGTGNGTLTVLEYLRKNNIYTAETGQALDIMPLRELKGAGSGATNRMVVYRRDPDVVRFHLPMPRRVLQPRQKSLMGFEQGIIARTGGTEWRLPSAAAYGDGI